MSFKNLFLDSETCGLHGLPVLLQYAVEDGPIELYDVWLHPVEETLRLIEWMMEHTIIGFNLVFDHFQLCKLYTIWRLLPPDWIPIEHVNEIALKEPEGRDGPCLKPANALDLLLHSRKGPLQSLMNHDDIRIKRVPTALAYALADELEGRVKFDSIYFARTADPDAPRWQVFERHDRYGDLDPDFKDVVLKFNPAGGLKYLAEHVLKLQPKFHYADVEPASRPREYGYAPFALAVASPDTDWAIWAVDKKGKDYIAAHAWPGLIRQHVKHWAGNEQAREYAYDDIVYTRALYEHFGRPEPGDDDSVLACMVAAVRWRGFTIDRERLETLAEEADHVLRDAPLNINAPHQVRAYITEMMDDTERVILEESTKKTNLEAITAWVIEEDEPCLCGEDCPRCHGGVVPAGKHPAAARATEVLAIKTAAKEKELYEKLLRAGRFHASFNVIGALSSRMSGADGLNAQGIKHTTKVRQAFPLAWAEYVLSGGDFDAYEVCIADAVCDDENLRAELMAGKKIHALFAMALFPGHTYEEIRATEGTENDLYTKGKQGFFGTILYGGTEQTLINKLGVKEADAIAAIENFGRRYTGVKDWRGRIFDDFCSMRQPGGIGTQVIWVDPADYVESFLGFRRYFTLENAVCKALFDLAQKPPKHWRDVKVKVVRRDRVQTAGGAVQSALYGAAFAIQAANMRAAANHQIQSPGAQITKSVQRKIWDLQPAGLHEFLVAPLNVHDELMVINHPDVTGQVTEAVRESVESYRPHVPLIGMTWNETMDNWAEKKGGTKTVSISWKNAA